MSCKWFDQTSGLPILPETFAEIYARDLALAINDWLWSQMTNLETSEWMRQQAANQSTVDGYKADEWLRRAGDIW